MRRVAWIGLALAAVAGCRHATIAWSPDGRWLAFVAVERPIGPRLAPGWLFDPTPAPKAADPARGLGPTAYRIWATRSAGDGPSFLIEDSPLPLTGAAWSPDGASLAFGRLVPQAEGRLRFEVVVQEAPDRRRVLAAQPLDAWKPDLDRLPALAPAWSPDGRYLALPRLQPPGMTIVRADNGRELKAIDDAYLPSWSPDSSRLAFIRGGDPEALHVLDPGFNASRVLLDVGAVGQAPIWSPDGSMLMTVRAQTRRRPDGRPVEMAEFVRVRADTGQVEKKRTLTSHVFGVDQALSEVSVALDPSGENLFFTAAAEGQGTLLVWLVERTNAVQNRFFPLGLPTAMGPLSPSPDGATLAMRFGPPDLLAPPGLFDPLTSELTPLVPDDAARLEWLRLLIETARAAIQSGTPTPAAGPRPAAPGPPPARPTILPLPSEFAANPDLANQLRRIGKLGGRVCERPADAPAPPEGLDVLIAEARPFFAYLRGDYEAAAREIEALDRRVGSADHRLRLLGLRAQAQLAAGEFEKAKPAIEYLGRVGPARASRYERVGEAVVLSPISDPSRSWPEALAEQSKAIVERAALEASVNGAVTLGHRNPDAPDAPLLIPPDGRPPFRLNLPDPPFQLDPFRPDPPR